MTRAPPCVLAWGLRVRSAIDLPGAMPLPPDYGAADLDIGFGPAVLADRQCADGPYQLGRDAFTFSMPGVACYLCKPATIVVDPAPDARSADIAAMLIATVVPAVLWMRGEVVLHAAAAILPGTTRAVAVLGRSGSGKSTLLARAAAAGARLVADDSVCVRVGAEGLRISGLPGGYFAPLTVADADRPFRPVPAGQQSPQADLGALLVLDDDLPPGRLRGAEAVGALLTHRHRPRIARLLGREAAVFASIVRIARTCSIYAGPRRPAASIAMVSPAP